MYGPAFRLSRSMLLRVATLPHMVLLQLSPIALGTALASPRTKSLTSWKVMLGRLNPA